MPNKVSREISLFLILLISFIALSQYSNLAIGNPYHFPTSNNPNLNPPTVMITSPKQNQTLSSNNFILNFTVIKPEKWLIGGPYQWDGGEVYTFMGKINFIQYSLDGILNEKISVNDTKLLEPIYPVPSRKLDFSLNLTDLPEGIHELTVFAYGEFMYYRDFIQYNDVAGNTTINFTIFLSNTPQNGAITEIQNKFSGSEAMVVVSAILGALTTFVVVIVYFKKRKRHDATKHD